MVVGVVMWSCAYLVSFVSSRMWYVCSCGWVIVMKVAHVVPMGIASAPFDGG